MEKTNQIKQADIRERNLKNVYTYVLHHPGVSRAKIAKALELSRPSSSSLVDELLTIGAIFEDGKDRREGGLGRIPIQIKADFRKDYAIVLFWQRGKIDGSIVSLQQGKPYSERRMGCCSAEVPSPKEFGRVSLDIIRSLRKKQEGRYHYIGTGIVLPGIVDRERKCILSYPLRMDIESGKEVISELEESGEEAIGLFNDNAILGYAAMERLGLQEKNFLYVNLSEGVGAAYFMGGEVFGGAGGNLTQFGHSIVHPGGTRCSCGSLGCLEAEIGRRGIRALIGREEPLQRILENKDRERREYEKVRRKYIEDFALALSNVSTVVFPDLILLGGAFPLWGEEFLKELREEISRIGFSYIMQDLRLLYSEETEAEVRVKAADYFFSREYRFMERGIRGIHLG